MNGTILGIILCGIAVLSAATVLVKLTRAVFNAGKQEHLEHPLEALEKIANPQADKQPSQTKELQWMASNL